MRFGLTELWFDTNKSLPTVVNNCWEAFVVYAVRDLQLAEFAVYLVGNLAKLLVGELQLRIGEEHVFL